MPAPSIAVPGSRWAAAAAAAAVAATLAIPPASAEPEPASANVYRFAGDDRVETALDLANPDALYYQPSTAVLATGDNPADALAVTPVAAHHGAPVLLTRSNAGIEPDLGRFVTRDLLPNTKFEEPLFSVSQIEIVGGPNAVPFSIENSVRQLDDDAYASRTYGDNRYETAYEVYEELGRAGYGVPWSDTALVVASDPASPDTGWPDALSAANLISGKDEVPPIVLTQESHLPPASEALLDSPGIDHATILGSPLVIDAVAEGQIGSHVDSTSRLQGPDRYATNMETVRYAAQQPDVITDEVFVTTGEDWPDGLTAAAAAAHFDGILLLVDGHDAQRSSEALAWLAETQPRNVYIVGGPSAVSEGMESLIEAAAGGETLFFPMGADER